MARVTTLADELEATVEAAVAALLATQADLKDEYGDRPIGFSRGSTLDRLEEYIARRDDPAFWQEQIASAAQTDGVQAAELQVMRMAAQMEALLDRWGGPPAVHRAILERRVARVLPSVKKAERITSQPPWRVLPPLPPMDDVELLAEIAAADPDVGSAAMTGTPMPMEGIV